MCLAQFYARACVRALRGDARRAPRRAGTTTAALTGNEAMWSGSDEDQARKRRDRDRLIAAGGSPTVDALALLEAQRHGTPPIGSG